MSSASEIENGVPPSPWNEASHRTLWIETLRIPLAEIGPAQFSDSLGLDLTGLSREEEWVVGSLVLDPEDNRQGSTILYVTRNLGNDGLEFRLVTSELVERKSSGDALRHRLQVVLATLGSDPNPTERPLDGFHPEDVVVAARREHPLLDALAGNVAARSAIEQENRIVERLPGAERTPQADLLLLDADDEQEYIVAQIAAGNSLVVKALPGTGGTQTVVNAIGALVSQNKRVLVVSGHPVSLSSVSKRLSSIRLQGLAVSSGSLRRDIVQSISRVEKAQRPNVDEINDALSRLRRILVNYREALARPNPSIGVSALDGFAALGTLALLEEPPSTTVRLSRRSLEKLPTDRAGLAKMIVAILSPDSDADTLDARLALKRSLHDFELDPLIDDLIHRDVPASQIAAEFEHCWWKSALQGVIDSEPALLDGDTLVVERLENDFRIVDEAHVAANSQLLGWQVAERWRTALVDWPDEAHLLKRALGREQITAFDIQSIAPHLLPTVAPVWLASPQDVDTIDDAMPFDALILLDAGATTLAENVNAIYRAKQIVAFGDPVTQSPLLFETPIPETDGSSAVDRRKFHDSALARLGELLPILTLTRSYSSGGDDLVDLVNRRFYGGEIVSFPWAGSFLGRITLALTYVDGFGTPDPLSGLVESPRAEVNRVIELVINHAARHPLDSLLVVTASQKHADHVMEAMAEEITSRVELEEFFRGDRPEPFVVLTIDQAAAVRRDRVIFSIGYGKTPQGGAHLGYGSFGRPGGERRLAVAMTRARQSMVVVSSFKPEDLEDSHMQHGEVALAEMLAEIGTLFPVEPPSADKDPLLLDLGHRLRKRGLKVEVGYRGKLGLVASDGGICVSIQTEMSVRGATLRESLRLHPRLLRSLGWISVCVHSFELINNPEQVVEQISDLIGVFATPDRTATRSLEDALANSHWRY